MAERLHLGQAVPGVDAGEDRPDREAHVAEDRADEGGVFVAVAAAAGVDELGDHRVLVHGERGGRGAVEVLEGDRVGVGGEEAVEIGDDLPGGPAGTVPGRDRVPRAGEVAVDEGAHCTSVNLSRGAGGDAADRVRAGAGTAPRA
ncbi:hypothetical protein MTQ16_10885 [Corynebacterium bovis]